MIRLILLLCILPVVGVLADTPVAFDATDERAVQLALRALKMTERDLAFQKTNVEAEFVMPAARAFLQQPLALPAFGQSIFSNLSTVTTLAGLTAAAGALAGAKGHPVQPAGPNPGLTIPGAPPAAVAAAQTIYAAALQVQPLLPQPDKAAFDAFALTTFTQDRTTMDIAPELLRRDAALELADDETARAILDAGYRLDQDKLATAFQTLAGAVDTAIAGLRTHQFTENFQVETDTPLGKIIIGGVGRNVYTNEAFLIIDLGGDDVYLNSAGGANGLAGRPISIVIDLGGNDQFISKRSFSQGSGVFGIGILAALGSNCTFQAKHVSQGAGFFGCGLLMTGAGQQTFEADTFCQGAGTFGTGILWQRGGDTTYRAAELAQGFGGVQGVGVLLDENGDDSYIAGGKYPCGWLAGHYFSLSQGFGYGMRPYAGGGIGILCDLHGNDHYQADVYGQGASYWYSVGLLLDGDGDDRYDALQYCQGAGIHLSTGALIDFAGNDTYTAGHICQGAAHDYGVGMLIDRAGNNKFTGETTAQGAAINNSFALLLDHAGTNTYVGTDPKQSQATGHNGDKREYGSIALLLDLGGHGSYSQGQTNNAIWLKPLYGAGLDAELIPESPVGRAGPARRSALSFTDNGAVSHRALPTMAGARFYTLGPVDPHHPIEQLFRVATSDRPEAGKAWDDLKHLGTSALEYLIPRLGSPNIMVRIKVEELVDHLNTNSVPPLIAGIRTATDDDVARLCCYYLARFGDQISGTGVPPVNSPKDKRARRPFHYAEAVQAVLPLLKRDKCRTTAFYTLGHMRATEAFRPAMAALEGSSPELVRLRATQLLGKIGDRRAIPALLLKLDDEIYDVRYAAEDALVNFGKPSRGPLRDAYQRATPRAQPHILEALAKLGDETALTWAREYYRDDDPLVRTAVLQSLTATLTPAPASAAK